jgi:vitamin B12 transporter
VPRGFAGRTLCTSTPGTSRLSAIPGEVGGMKNLQLFLIGGVFAFAALPQAVAQTAGVLDEVIVTGTIVEVSRRRIGTAMSVISGEEMEMRGYNSLADVMRTQPAIGVSNNGGVGKQTTLRIRGEEGYRTLFMIDGVKALDPSTPQVSPSFNGLLTTSDLERVEVLRGPQGFIYGADAGGVVNVMTRSGEGPISGRVGLEGGEFGTRKVDASVSGGTDRADYFIAVTDLETDGFNARPSDAVLMDEDGAENTTLHAKLGWDATDNMRLQFVARDIDASAMFDGCGFPTVHDCMSTIEQTTWKLSANHDSERFSNRFGYSEVDIDRNSFASGISAFPASGSISRFEYTGSFQANHSTTLVYGLDLQNEDIVTSGTPDDRDQDGYYFEYQGQFNENFYVTVGARYDDNEDFGSATSARASASYIQSLGSGRSIKYRATYGTGFRPPSMLELAYNAGPFAFPPAAGLALVEETSEGYDIGIEYDTPAGLHVEITYFDQKIEDAIEFDLVGFSGYLQIPGRSTSDGFEVAARIPVGENFEIIANWTGNDAKDSVGNQRVRRPETLANLGLNYISTDEDFRFMVNYRISRDAVDQIFGLGFVPLDDYEVLDLSAAYRVNDSVEIYGRLENALDQTYVEITDYFTAERAVYGGVRLRF